MDISPGGGPWLAEGATLEVKTGIRGGCVPVRLVSIVGCWPTATEDSATVWSAIATGCITRAKGDSNRPVITNIWSATFERISKSDGVTVVARSRSVG